VGLIIKIMENKKYELLLDTEKEVFGVKLFRIKAKVSFGEISAGDTGGYVESEKNLSVYGKWRSEGMGGAGEKRWGLGNGLVIRRGVGAGNVGGFGNGGVCGDAGVYGNARVYGNAWVYGDAEVCWFSKFGSSNRTTTAFRNKDQGVTVVCGCFIGTIEEFAEKVKNTHKDNDRVLREYRAIIEVIKIKFEK